MKKLTLNLEALEIETFEPEASVEEQPGSVVAHQLSGNPVMCYTWNPQDYHCYFSAELGGRDCTPVCHTYDCTADLC